LRSVRSFEILGQAIPAGALRRIPGPRLRSWARLEAEIAWGWNTPCRPSEVDQPF